MVDHLIYELENIDKEVKRLKEEQKILIGRKKKLTDEIVAYMTEKGETEIKSSSGGKTFVLKEHTRRRRKGDKQIKTDIMSVLNNEGIEGPDAEELYLQIRSATKGPANSNYTLSSA